VLEDDLPLEFSEKLRLSFAFGSAMKGGIIQEILCARDFGLAFLEVELDKLHIRAV
jgi:hypothetical protein